MTIFVTWQLKATLDSIRNACNVCLFEMSRQQLSQKLWRLMTMVGVNDGDGSGARCRGRGHQMLQEHSLTPQLPPWNLSGCNCQLGKAQIGPKWQLSWCRDNLQQILDPTEHNFFSRVYVWIWWTARLMEQSHGISSYWNKDFSVCRIYLPTYLNCYYIAHDQNSCTMNY